MPKWDEITRNEKYQNLPPEARAQLKTEWFKSNLLPEIESKPSLKEIGAEKVYEWFMQQPDDTGQGYVTSMLGAAGRGFGEMVPGAIEGVGALTGSEGLREFGQDVRGGLESISPVNPIYAETIPAKLFQTGGQVGSVLATAGAGGLAGKALGGVGAATTGMRAAPLASAFLQGSAEGAREAEEYGMSGPEAYLRTLAGGAIEAGTEFLPFGLTAETALAKRLLTGAPRTGTFLGAVGSEAGEEGLGQVASNIATKTLAPAGVETPGITEGALEATAYGAAGGVMIGGVNALISTPPERQTQIQKDLQAEAGAIPKDTVPDQTNEEKIAAMNAGGTTVVDPEGKTAVILPAVQAEEPSMLAPEIAIAADNLNATQNTPFTDVSGQTAAAILAENNQIASQLAVSTQQAAEEAGVEVAPSPAMEMPSPPQGVDMALTPLSPIINEAPIITPEEESLAAKRRADLLSSAADVAKGKTKAQVSPAVTAMVTPQPVTTQEDAARKIPLEGSVREELQDRIESREAEEAGAGDQLRSSAESEVEGEVVPSALPPGRHRFSKSKLSKLPKQVVDALMQRKTSLDNSFNFTSSPSINIDEDSYYTLVNPATGESRRLTTPGEFAGTATGKNVVKPTANIPLPKGAFVVYQKKTPGGGMSLGVVEGSFEEPKKAITPPTEPTPDTEGMVTPGGVATERDLSKPEQMTPEEFNKQWDDLEDYAKKSERKGKLDPSQKDYIPVTKEEREALSRDWREFSRMRGYSASDIAKYAKWYKISGQEDQLLGAKNDTWRSPTNPNVRHKQHVELAISESRSVSSAAVDTYGIKLPEGYVKQGELYVFQPQTKQAAAETQTPESVGRGLGGSRGVQSEPSGINPPEVANVSTETETTSSEKSPVTEAAIRDLEESISKLPEKAQAKWTPEVMAKARDFYDSTDRNQSRLDGLTQIQKNKVYDSLYRADKAAAAEQDRIEKVQKARDKEIEKEERESAKKEAEILKREEMRSKAIDSIIGASEKKKRKFGQVTNSDAIAAVAMLVSSKDVPGVLTTWIGTKDEFLRNTDNRLADPEIYARVKAGELVEGFFNKGRAYVFLDGIGVSENDMLRGEPMNVSPQIAAVRRVLLHESLVHRGIHGLPLRHRRLILNWVRQNFTPQQLDELAELYTEYANWRNSDYEFEALAEEFLAKKVDSLTEIPKDGPMAKLMDILRQIWDFIVGYKREPTLSDLKSVIKLLKSGAEALTNDTLKDGGGVKLSYAGEKAIENLPEERRQFMRDSLDAAKAMAAAGKSSEEIRAATGWFPGKYDGKMRWEVPDDGASLKVSETIRAGYSAEDVLSHPDLFSAYPELKSIRVAFVPMREGMRGNFDSFGNGKIEVNNNLSEAEKLSTLLHEVQHWVQGKEGFSSGGNPEVSIRNARIEANRKMLALKEQIDENSNAKAMAKATGDEATFQEKLKKGWQLDEEMMRAWEIGQQDPVVLYRRLAGEIEARDVQARKDLTPEQRAATAPYSSENIAPEDAIVLFGSGPQASVQFSSETSAAFTAGSEAARSTLYSERDMDIREAIRRTYEAMPKQNSVAVPIGDLFAKTEELMPDVTQDEFSNVLQDLFEDNGAVLQEGESDFFVTTPEGRRAGFVVVMPRAAKASRIKADDAAATRLKDDIAAIENGSFKAKFGGVQFTDFPASERTVKPKEFYSDAAIRFVDDLQDKGSSIEDIAFSIQSPDFLEAVGIENNLSAQDALTIEVRNRVNNELRREKRPDRKKRLDKMNKRLSGYWQGTGSKAGANLGIRKHLINDPRYRWMFIKDLAEKGIAESVENVARGNMDSPEGFADKANAEGEKASEQSGDQTAEKASDLADDVLMEEGESLLNEENKGIWNSIKNWLRQLAILARIDAEDVKTGSKASKTENEEFYVQMKKLSKEERQKKRDEIQNNINKALKKLKSNLSEAEKASIDGMVEAQKKRGPRVSGSETKSDLEIKSIMREMNKARPGQKPPLSKQISWRQIFSQKANTVAEYRQRIFDAISSNEAFQNLPDDKKAKLADLFSEAWESKRKDILDRMLTNLINQEEAAKRISKEGAKALREQRMKLVEDINLGILDAEEVMKRLAEKFGIKTEFTEQERQKIDSLIETIQDETLNRVKRNKAAYELLKTLSGDMKIPVVKMLADYWVASVLSGMNTATSIALAVGNGAFELLSGVYRILTAGVMNPKDVPAEIMASFKAMAAFLKAFKREGRLAWQYLVTGDREFLDPSMNDVLNDLNYESIGRSTALAEKMAESDKIAQKVMGVWMRSVSRLLTALDSFNAGVTKAGSLPIVARQLDLNTDGIAKVEQAMNLQNYKDIIIQRDFAGVAPKTQREKAVLDSWAKDEMMAELDKYGKFSENANFYGQQGAMTLDPSGLGGFFYRAIKSLTGAATTGADKFLAESQRKWKQAEKGDKVAQALQLGLAYFLQFGAYNSANLAGLRFARFAGNKFNQGLSFLPGIGMFRLYEASLDKTHIEAEEAFTDMILRNQLAGTIVALAGYAMLQAISDEPDDEKRVWFINGSWANLTPEKKQQKLAAGQKEFTIGIGDKVFSYQNWPISSALAAIGGLSDLIRFSPEQWNEKNAVSRLTSAATSGVFAATEIPALSGFQTLFGNNLSSKDPNEKKLDRFANVMAGWGGGFVPRILKDFDYLAEPELRKYETLWEKTASHIPVYRRYVGDEYYDILGKQIEKKTYPGSREFMEKASDPEYQVLGKLNSRGIWLTPANAEYRMVGKGRNRRRLTQEEADAYSLETGKGYRQMLLRYGQRALQMPTERARAFLSDKADEVRDRALKKVYRGYK